MQQTASSTKENTANETSLLWVIKVLQQRRSKTNKKLLLMFTTDFKIAWKSSEFL